VLPKLVDQECQTLLSDLPAHLPKTIQTGNGITNSRVTNPSSWTSNTTEHPSLATSNDNNEDGDDYDPLYAIPNHLGIKTIAITKSPKQYPSPHQGGSYTSSSPHHNISLETESSLPNNTSKCSSPYSVPNTTRTFNLERSQSLRVSRKSQRSLLSSSKGGSLR
jgi:hypothetical protein